jgi:hypothetical protein
MKNLTFPVTKTLGFTLVALVYFCITPFANLRAESRLGYTAEFQALLNYTSKNTDLSGRTGTTDTTSGPALNLRLNFSTIGLLFFKDSSFMVGDHIGFGIGGGYFSRTSQSSSFMMPVNAEAGLKAAYAINDNIEVGIKWLYIGFDQFMDYTNDFYVGAKNVFIPTVRYKDFMGSVGFGTTILADNPKLSSSTAATGTYLMAEVRYFFGNKYILARAEKYSGSVEIIGVTRTDSATQFTIGFGMM